MSEKLRRKKNGEGKDAKSRATDRGRVDDKANKDKPDVHNERKGSDSFENDLKRSS